MTIGAFVAGLMGDRLGRRTAYQVNLLIFGAASLAGAFAPDINWLTAARLVMGIGIGAEVVCGYVMIGEFMPPGTRARWAGGLAIITNSALFVANVLGAADHTLVRLAVDVRPRWHRLARRLAVAAWAAGVAAVARKQGAVRRGRGNPRADRGSGRAPRPRSHNPATA